VKIVNLHYHGTVETDVYVALRKRIGLFQSVVGRLQPILAQLPRTIAESVLKGGRSTTDSRERVATEVTAQVDRLEGDASALDIDALADDALEIPPRPAPALDLEDMDVVLRRANLLPDGVAVRPLKEREYGYLAPGMSREVRVTTDPAFFEEHSESLELWSPGAPVFPDVNQMVPAGEESSESGARRPKDLRF
jgi:hypothetical protein